MLVESQLFGHVKAAFSGAVRDEEGFVRAANGGTLFLDELADLPAPSQAALLRVLQEREVVPVGSARAVKVDLRLASATHRSLATMVTESTFRRDLFARIAGFEVTVPPLRERKDDLGVLIALLLQRIMGERATSVALTVEVGQALLAYDWPYNVRELEQLLGVCTALSGGGLIEHAHLPIALSGALVARRDEGARAGESDARPGDEKLRMQLLDELARHAGEPRRRGARHGQGADGDPPLVQAFRNRSERVPAVSESTPSRAIHRAAARAGAEGSSREAQRV
jgi:transcriptional regulator with PAS, ATPase and Fis domain